MQDILANPAFLRAALTSFFFFFSQNAFVLLPLHGGGRQDIPAIGRRLGVSHLLLGSVRRSGGRVRVSTRLVRADDGSHAWARTYDRELGDVLAIEREIATDVARTLEIRLAGTTARSGVQAVDPAAHDQYLLARFLWSRRSGGDLAAARAHLERAVSLDPNHAQAWALLSGVRFVQIFPDGADADAALAAMREAVTRAVALAPDSGEVHARAAQYYGAAGDPRRAMEHWERANALAPGDFLVLSFWVGRTLDRGKFEEALEYQRRAIELDPVGALSRYNLVATLAINGRYGEARQELARARRLNPNSPNLELAAAELLVLEGRHVEGLAAARALPAGAERDRLLVLAYGGLGRRTEADAAYAALLARGDPRSLHRIAEVHAWRGDADAAFEWLERAWQAMSAAARVPGERLQPVGFLDSSFLRPLHGDPRLARYFGQPDRELPT